MWRTFPLTTLLAVALSAQTGPSEPQQWRKFGEQAGGPPPAESQAPPPEYSGQPAPAPAQLTIPPGTWITVRMNEPLSSDRNQPGDTFTATLAQPLVAGGLVIARRGQTVAGRVDEAQKARSSGSSRLGIELTEISLVDGQQVQLHTQLVERAAPGSNGGRELGTVAATTGIGAAIGAAADGGFGAGVGAIAGAAAGTIGVLATRGHATEVYPETVLTFRTLQPIAISTDHSPQAFAPVSQADYEPRLQQPRRPGPGAAPPAYYSAYPAPYYYPPYYYAPYAPYWYGPSFYFYSGPGFYYRGGRFRR